MLNGPRFSKSIQQEQSPTRQMRSAVQGPTSAPRSLSSTSIPNLAPAQQESQLHAPTPQKPVVVSDLKDARRWPVSPRLRSPPPQLSKPGTPVSAVKRKESETPALNVQRATPSPAPSDTHTLTSESDTEGSLPHSGTRTPTRGALETVAEVSLPNSPNQKQNSLLEQVRDRLAPSDALSDNGADEVRSARASSVAPMEHDGSNTIDRRRTTSVPPPTVMRQSSALSSKQIKAPAEGSAQNMTVETETVPSIPQVALATSSKVDGTSSTLKAKPSSETIRPKKDKKKAPRKQAVSSGNGSSKADVFEANIANAVDEANTSDSEETFVYDSNPPDANHAPHRRFHSRTPSATSMASQADRQNLRSIYGVMEGSHTHGHKKGMKFVNTSNGSGADSTTPGDEDGRGTGRSTNGSARGSARHHHHIGRWGRQPGGTHPSLFDNESPFSAGQAKMSGSRSSSGPPGSRQHRNSRGQLSTKRSVYQLSSTYEQDEVGADDERTPLMGSVRNGRRRKFAQNGRQAESQIYTQPSSYLNRFAACLVLTMMFLLVITGAIGFMFATSQPMTEIEVTSISNVVTSEQLLIFDLTVKAHNPNIVVVTIDQANLEIFAKSDHGDDDGGWWKDNPFFGDPSDGDDDSAPNFLLGRITEFDSPLTFEGSLFHQGNSSSTGELQLANPGNGTKNGVERWDRIFQNEFDLIVKGVVKYSLPLSARVRSATISGRTTVKPNSANDPNLKPNSTAPAPELE